MIGGRYRRDYIALFLNFCPFLVMEQIFEVGDTVTVIAVEGVKLICK